MEQQTGPTIAEVIRTVVILITQISVISILVSAGASRIMSDFIISRRWHMVATLVFGAIAGYVLTGLWSSQWNTPMSFLVAGITAFGSVGIMGALTNILKKE